MTVGEQVNSIFQKSLLGSISHACIMLELSTVLYTSMATPETQDHLRAKAKQGVHGSRAPAVMTIFLVDPAVPNENGSPQESI